MENIYSNFKIRLNKYKIWYDLLRKKKVTDKYVYKDTDGSLQSDGFENICSVERQYNCFSICLKSNQIMTDKDKPFNYTD